MMPRLGKDWCQEQKSPFLIPKPVGVPLLQICPYCSYSSLPASDPTSNTCARRAPHPHPVFLSFPKEIRLGNLEKECEASF